jgi:sortase (surface protein transpeptidase)
MTVAGALAVPATGALVLTMGLAGCAGTGTPPRPSSAAAGVSASPSVSRSVSDPAAGYRSPRTHPVVALPVRLRIPKIGVDTPLLRLGVDTTGAVQVPGAWQRAGWYTGSARPGQTGPAVILGHVDSTRGPAVFFRLVDLRPGDVVRITRADLTDVVFRVTGRIEVAKSRFPTDLVYGATLEPSLRLVTCGGSFDATSGHYRDNIIVTAVPAVSP